MERKGEDELGKTVSLSQTLPNEKKWEIPVHAIHDMAANMVSFSDPEPFPLEKMAGSNHPRRGLLRDDREKKCFTS